MAVRRYPSVEEMPAPWREPDDPGNLRAVAVMLALYRRLHQGAAAPRGVRRFRTIQDANAGRGDPYRGEQPRAEEGLSGPDATPPHS